MSKSNDKNTTLKTIKSVYSAISKIILYSLFAFLIAFAIVMIIYVVDLKRNQSMGLSRVPIVSAYVIISPSMVPTVKVQDAVIVRRMNAKKLKKGDIITFISSDSRYAGLTVTHRVVGIEKGQAGQLLFRTKGDNNNSEDSALVTESNIYGKVILRIPKIGYLQSFLLKSYGWLIAVVIPCLIVIIYDIFKLSKTFKKNVVRKKKKDKKEVIEEEEILEII